MKRPHVPTLLLLLLAGTIAAAGETDGWQNVSDNLLKTVPEHNLDIPGARRIGGIAVDRHSGDVIAGLNGPPFGLYRSKDAGETWQRIDDGNVEGGWVRSYSIRIDHDTPGRIAAFRVGPPAPLPKGAKSDRTQAVSAYTLDGGKTWTQIAEIRAFQGFTGFPHGMVDWTQTPVRIVSQSRIRPKISVSEDGGKTWTPLAGKQIDEVADYGRRLWYQREYPSKKDNSIRGYGIVGDVILAGSPKKGILRTEDGGKTAEVVSDILVTGITPISFQEKLYWATEKGIIISGDAGKTWSLYGSELPNVRKGPFFGKDPSTMVVVSDDGVFKTMDSGRTWSKISELYVVPDAYRLDWPPVLLRTDYAWDHTRNLLYVAGFAGSAYKKEVK